MLDLAPVDRTVIDRAKGSFAVNLRALDAIHVATAEILAAEAEGESVEFWTHDDRQAAAALSRGLTVRGT
jgi:predicted nucleic acid-binding protein